MFSGQQKMQKHNYTVSMDSLRPKRTAVRFDSQDTHVNWTAGNRSGAPRRHLLSSGASGWQLDEPLGFHLRPPPPSNISGRIGDLHNKAPFRHDAVNCLKTVTAKLCK